MLPSWVELYFVGEISEVERNYRAPAGDGFGPLTLAWSMFVIASNLGANLWLTRKFCFWRGLASLPAFAASGAVIGFLVAAVTALIGLGETEIGYFAEAFSGGGAALLSEVGFGFWLLASEF